MIEVVKRVVGRIFKTRDYNKFKFIEGNRPIVRKHVDQIKQSINAGLIINHLVTVTENCKYFRILDGQHFFTAAMETNTEFPFRIVEVPESQEIEAILKMNCHQKPWESSDYRDLWIAKGRKPYIDLKRF